MTVNTVDKLQFLSFISVISALPTLTVSRTPHMKSADWLGLCIGAIILYGNGTRGTPPLQLF